MVSHCVPDARDLARAWRGITGHLQIELIPAAFETWFAGTRPLQLDERGLVVEARNAFVAEGLNQRFAHHVRRVAASFLESDVEVRFVPPGPAQHLTDTGCEPAGPVCGEINRRLDFTSYLAVDGNRLALHCARVLLSRDDPAISPLAIWGPPGVGKTHLLHAIANAAAALGWQVACLSGEQFVNRYASAVRHRHVEDFQATIRAARLLVIDDLQYLAGKSGTQDELTYTVDAVVNAGGLIATAGEQHPRQLGLPERLATRLCQGVVAALEPFTTADRRAFVQELVRRRHAPLPAWAIDRIAAVPATSVRVLQGAVNGAIALDQCRLLTAGRLDAELTALLARETIAASHPAEDIVEAVARIYQTTVAALASASRTRSDAEARAVAAALLQEQGRSLSEIGRLFGRDRTTIGPLAVRGRKIIERRPELRRVAG